MKGLNHGALAVLAMLACGSALAGEPDTKVDDRSTSVTLARGEGTDYRDSQDFKALLVTARLPLGLEGWSGELPENTASFQALLQRPDADEAMKELFAPHQHAATRLYGLSGLYFTDRAAFETGLSEMRESAAAIRVREGCIVGDVPVRQLISIEDEESDIPLRSRFRFPSIDFARGGIPEQLKSLKARQQPTPALAPAVEFELDSEK